MVQSLRIENTVADLLAHKAQELLARQVRERSGVSATATGGEAYRVILAVEPGIGCEGYRLEAPDERTTRITGNDPRGLLYGVGEFTPGGWQGTSIPAKEVRGMYLATHFHNFYHDAPIAEVERYVEELALWGCNALSVWFDMHHYTGLSDPAAQEMIGRLHAILRAANGVGMGAALTLLANEAYHDSPVALRAAPTQWHYHVELCPSQPGAMELMLRWREEVFRAFADLNIEYVWLWPYDQGGCWCDVCAPWGANGFLKISEPVARLVHRTWPQAKTVLSTWCFDYEIPGEYEGLWRVLDSRPDWVDYLMVDAHGDFPTYVIEHGAPAGLPVLNFTEISMHAMSPWGGYGANPLPCTIQRRWDMSQHLLAGGFPYSEGIYEDLNKAMLFGLYWAPDRSTRDIVREYAAYEYSPDVAEAVTGAVERMEAGMQHGLAGSLQERFWRAAAPLDAAAFPDAPYALPNVREAEAIYDALCAVEAQLTPQARRAWRWRMLWLRAALDAELHASGGRPTANSEAYFAELIAIYHAEGAEPAVHPPTLDYLKQRSGL